MNRSRLFVNAFGMLTMILVLTSVAQAQATRTWVSGVGDDVNPCSRTAPCKTWAGAISKTAASGEIDALDPAGFGAVTITKSITLDGTGTMGSILASLTTGIIINAAATDVVTIRGVSINGAGNGIRGMNILQAKTVNIEDCVIFRFAGDGVTVNESNGIQLNVRNTVIRDNTGDGIGASTTTGQVKASIVNSSFLGNTNGLHAKGNSRITADQCTFAGNTSNGVFAEGVGGIAVANISNSSILNNFNGVQAATGGSVVRLNNCDIFTNTGSGALVGAGGEVDTFGNNRIFSNNGDNCVGCTPRAVS